MSTTSEINTKFTHHEVSDNELRIDGKLTIALEPTIITVGVTNSEKEEIIQKEDGTYYRREAVESKEVYNKKNQRKRNWFILALETGQNNRRYFPGAEIHGLVSGSSPINIYEEPSTTSNIIGTIDPETWVIIKNITSLNEQPDFYKIRTSAASTALVGYIQGSAIKNDLHKIYEAPFK